MQLDNQQSLWIAQTVRASCLLSAVALFTLCGPKPKVRPLQPPSAKPVSVLNLRQLRVQRGIKSHSVPTEACLHYTEKVCKLSSRAAECMLHHYEHGGQRSWGCASHCSKRLELPNSGGSATDPQLQKESIGLVPCEVQLAIAKSKVR